MKINIGEALVSIRVSILSSRYIFSPLQDMIGRCFIEQSKRKIFDISMDYSRGYRLLRLLLLNLFIQCFYKIIIYCRAWILK